jgi:polyhydroxybutyrate depolymerase
VPSWRPVRHGLRRPSPGPAGRGRALVGAALVIAIAAGCSTTGASSAPPSTPSLPATTSVATARATHSPGCEHATADASPRSTPVDVSLRSSAVDRTYEQYLPARYDASPTPLVVDLHGYLSGAAGQASMSNFGAFAEHAGFVLVTPQGSGPLPYWNAVPHADLPDDVQFIADVIDDVSGRLCIDPARVYVDGMSNGAFLTSLIACRLSDKVAAVAAVAGLMDPAGCAPSRPIPILALHGTADQFVPFDGGRGSALATLAWSPETTEAFTDLPFGPAPAALAAWAAREGCTEPPEQQPVRGAVTVTRYQGCRGASTLELYVVAGAGHTWPGSALAKASESLLGPTTTDIDADELIWAFFAAHPMTP